MRSFLAEAESVGPILLLSMHLHCKSSISRETTLPNMCRYQFVFTNPFPIFHFTCPRNNKLKCISGLHFKKIIRNNSVLYLQRDEEEIINSYDTLIS